MPLAVKDSRDQLRNMYPSEFTVRWSRAIHWRVYSVPFYNSVWHLDGHHKLIRWKIVIDGGIDGFSRMVVFLRASVNNDASTVTEALLDACSSMAGLAGSGLTTEGRI